MPFSFSKRSHVGNLRQIRKQGKGRSSKRKENRRLSFLFAHRRGYGVVPCRGRGSLPRSAERNSLADPQRKNCRPDRVNRLRGPSTPAFRCRKRSRPSGRTRLRSSRTPAFRCRKRSRPSGANPLTQFARSGQPEQKRSRPVRANTLTRFVYPGQPVPNREKSVF